MGIIKRFAKKIFVFSKKYKIKPNTASGVFQGTGIGLMANIMFVLTTSVKANILKLTITFMFAIILLLIGSIERKEQ